MKKIDVKEFVNSLAIPEPHEYAELTKKVRMSRNFSTDMTLRLLDKTKSAQVNAGSLTSFTENVTGQNKSDVQNSTLLAQLAATKQYDRFTAPMDWYKMYTNVLGNIGWVQPAFAFDTYTSGDSTVNLDNATLGILEAIATNDELALIKATMNSLKNSGDDSTQMNIWNANASNGNNGNFQIFPVDALPNGDVVMVMDAMQFTAQTSHGGFLWWSWSSKDIAIQRAAVKVVLNEDVYSQVRDQIIKKLGDRAATYIADLPI